MNKWAAPLAIATFGAILPPAFAGDASTPPVSDSTPADGSVELSGGAVAAGGGHPRGKGSLRFPKRKHNITRPRPSGVAPGARSPPRPRHRLYLHQTLRPRRNQVGPSV